MATDCHEVASMRTVHPLGFKTRDLDEKHLMGIGAQNMITAEVHVG